MKEARDWADIIDAASGDVRRLSHVVRYSSIPVSVPENVAEHSYWVSLYAGLIHQKLNPGKSEMFGAVLLKAVVHDLAECVTGDVVRTFKYSSKSLKDEIDKAEEKIVKELPFCVQTLMQNQLDILSEGSVTYVDSVVKAADFMSLLQYMMREVRRGNREILNPYYIRMEDDLLAMRKRAAEEENPLEALYAQMHIFAKQVRRGG